MANTGISNIRTSAHDKKCYHFLQCETLLVTSKTLK